MKNILWFLILSIGLSANIALGGNKMNYVYEIVTWESNESVSDADMIEAVNQMVKDLSLLNGFLNQTLYKNNDNQWVDIYYWETETDAINSNEAMANKESFNKLIQLIKPNSVSIEIMSPLQSSGEILFK